MANERPTRDDVRNWQQQIAPGNGLRVRFDRGAWAAAAQREPWKWSWPKAAMQLTITGLLLLALVLFLDVQVTTLIGGLIGYACLIARAYRLHRRFVAANPSSTGSL